MYESSRKFIEMKRRNTNTSIVCFNNLYFYMCVCMLMSTVCLYMSLIITVDTTIATISIRTLNFISNIIQLKEEEKCEYVSMWVCAFVLYIYRVNNPDCIFTMWILNSWNSILISVFLDACTDFLSYNIRHLLWNQVY